MNLPPWLTFTLLTFAASTPFYFQIRNSGGAQSDQFSRIFRRLMWVPGLVAFGMRIATGQGFADLSFGLGSGLWLLLAAFLLPVLLELLTIGASTVFNLTRLDPRALSTLNGLVTVGPSTPLVLGNEPQTRLKFTANLLLTLGAGTLLTVLFSLFEEFGWRGYLQNHLIATFGLGWGLSFGGLLWGLWHAPLVLMGYQFPKQPRSGAWVYLPVFTICAAILTGYLYFLSGSLWVAALFNAATKTAAPLSTAALGADANSGRVRVVWLWLWGMFAGLALAFWRAAL